MTRSGSHAQSIPVEGGGRAIPRFRRFSLTPETPVACINGVHNLIIPDWCSSSRWRMKPIGMFHYAGRSWAFRNIWAKRWRSEEHTSELQSLMRISYAVFCFKKKITKQYNK